MHVRYDAHRVPRERRVVVGDAALEPVVGSVRRAVDEEAAVGVDGDVVAEALETHATPVVVRGHRRVARVAQLDEHGTAERVEAAVGPCATEQVERDALAHARHGVRRVVVGICRLQHDPRPRAARPVVGEAHLHAVRLVGVDAARHLVLDEVDAALLRRRVDDGVTWHVLAAAPAGAGEPGHLVGVLPYGLGDAALEVGTVEEGTAVPLLAAHDLVERLCQALGVLRVGVHDAPAARHREHAHGVRPAVAEVIAEHAGHGFRVAGVYRPAQPHRIGRHGAHRPKSARRRLRSRSTSAGTPSSHEPGSPSAADHARRNDGSSARASAIAATCAWS